MASHYQGIKGLLPRGKMTSSQANDLKIGQRVSLTCLESLNDPDSPLRTEFGVVLDKRLGPLKEWRVRVLFYGEFVYYFMKKVGPNLVNTLRMFTY